MDKLQIIRNALIETGNAPIDSLYDGSDEWVVADAGFDRGIRLLMGVHGWSFARRIETAARSGDSEDPVYTDAYAIPQTAWHILRVMNSDGYNLSSYKLLGGNILTTLLGDVSVMVEFVAQPEDDADWHPLAEEALTRIVEASCLRGLNEYFADARDRDVMANNLLAVAQTRHDQQTPARNAFRRGMTIARTTRRI